MFVINSNLTIIIKSYFSKNLHSLYIIVYLCERILTYYLFINTFKT